MGAAPGKGLDDRLLLWSKVAEGINLFKEKAGSRGSASGNRESGKSRVKSGSLLPEMPRGGMSWPKAFFCLQPKQVCSFEELDSWALQSDPLNMDAHSFPGSPGSPLIWLIYR